MLKRMGKIVQKAQKFARGHAFGFTSDLFYKFCIITASHRYIKELTRLKNKNRIKVVFLVLFDSVWKCDSLYRKMLSNDRFEPIIFISPVVNLGWENMVERIEQCKRFFESKNYSFIVSYDKINDTYLNLRKEINPDIIIYTSPWHGLIDDRYYITKYPDKLTIYIPYFLSEECGVNSYDSDFHNLLWRFYRETDFHYEMSRMSRTKGRNCVVTGYPGIECFLAADRQPENVWPIKDTAHKKIIWAPHHTLQPVGLVNYSCFLQYSDFMLRMAEKYRENVQIAFKPHPLLRNRLNEVWGKSKTDTYYSIWETMTNTSLNDGPYEDLFLTSDAMIHDSGSFLSEYLYINKPVLRTMNQVDPKQMFNDFGMECLANHYKAFNETDIEHFIQNVINDIDPMLEQRTKFIKKVLAPQNGMPSDNIIHDIVDSIENLRAFSELNHNNR